MNPEQENFDQLRRLLKLKRYEQPPPRYFNEFSNRVVARIRAGEAGSGAAALESGSWLQRLWALIEAKPMLPGVVGVAMCALLVLGAVYSGNGDNPVPPIDIRVARPAPTPPSSIFAEGQPTPLPSTNLVLQGGSLFDQLHLSSPPALVSRPFGNN